MLTLCWSDGNTLLPVSHTLLSTENPKNRLCASSEHMDTWSNGGKGRKLTQKKAAEVMLCLLQEAKEAAIPVRHVLFDTWFCSPASLLSIHELGYDVVAMAKNTEKVHYLHGALVRTIEKVLFVIITDGEENSSRKYSTGQIKERIEHQKEKHGWKFAFFGANMDAVMEASKLGIGAEFARGWMANVAGTAMAYNTMSAMMTDIQKR